MYKGLILNFVLLIYEGCTNSHILNNDEKEIVSQQVKQTLLNYYKDIKANGLTAEFKYLDKSADFFWVPPGYNSAITYDSVVRILNLSAPNFKTIDNKFDTLRIIPLSCSLATYTGKIRSVMTDTSGKVMSYSLLETGVMIKRGNEWKLLNGQTTMIYN